MNLHHVVIQQLNSPNSTGFILIKDNIGSHVIICRNALLPGWARQSLVDSQTGPCRWGPLYHLPNCLLPSIYLDIGDPLHRSPCWSIAWFNSYTEACPVCWTQIRLGLEPRKTDFNTTGNGTVSYVVWVGTALSNHVTWTNTPKRRRRVQWSQWQGKPGACSNFRVSDEVKPVHCSAEMKCQCFRHIGKNR